MTNEGVSYNQIWVDGVELKDIISGDVSAAETDLRRIIEQGGGWFSFSFAGGHYWIHVGPATTVIVRYVG